MKYGWEIQQKNSEKMNKNPIVSICCLTYNHESYIRQCLDGFLMQQCDFDFEVLIHDDASTDGTQKIIKEYHEKFPHIIKPIFQKENQYSKGVGVNRVYNFSRAIGKYIALCEGDDYWTDPLKLQKQVKILDNNPTIGISMGSFELLYQDTGFIKKAVNAQPNSKKDIYTIEDYLSHPFSQTASFLFRNDLYEIPEEKYRSVFAGDQFLVANIAKKSNIHFLWEPLSVYRVHTEGVSKKNTSLSYQEERLRLFIATMNDFTDNRYYDILKKRMKKELELKKLKWLKDTNRTKFLLAKIIYMIKEKFS